MENKNRAKREGTLDWDLPETKLQKKAEVLCLMWNTRANRELTGNYFNYWTITFLFSLSHITENSNLLDCYSFKIISIWSVKSFQPEDSRFLMRNDNKRRKSRKGEWMKICSCTIYTVCLWARHIIHLTAPVELLSGEQCSWENGLQPLQCRQLVANGLKHH